MYLTQIIFEFWKLLNVQQLMKANQQSEGTRIRFAEFPPYRSSALSVKAQSFINSGQVKVCKRTNSKTFSPLITRLYSTSMVYNVNISDPGMRFSHIGSFLFCTIKNFCRRQGGWCLWKHTWIHKRILHKRGTIGTSLPIFGKYIIRCPKLKTNCESAFISSYYV